MFLGLFVLDLWANIGPVRRTTWHRDFNLWPCWSIIAIRVFVLHLYNKLEVRRPFRSEDIMHFRSQHYIGLVTLTFAFDLETGLHYCGVDNLSTNFGVSRTLHSRLIGQHLSDASCDLATLTFDLGGHGACRWWESSCSVCVPCLNFVGLPFRKILGIYCVSINPSGDLDLWPFGL